MIFLKLETLDTVKGLAKACEKYKDDIDVDVVHGRQTVDGCSMLGILSLIGKIVRIVTITNQDHLINEFFEEIEKIGAYKI